ncbi:hypothetical protein [Rubrobacter calidifluminis]|uniref:hypothetical protein n=1 Tax=Rubrobacter calidifluminis TaxID=1392640 RepID=UPI002361335C|nr:hypothetical protein [Rubrobacter calidifluminis]
MSDPDVILLLAEDGHVVGRFSALGASMEEIGRAAWEDFFMRSDEIGCSNESSPHDEHGGG